MTHSEYWYWTVQSIYINIFEQRTAIIGTGLSSLFIIISLKDAQLIMVLQTVQSIYIYIFEQRTAIIGTGLSSLFKIISLNDAHRILVLYCPVYLLLYL